MFQHVYARQVKNASLSPDLLNEHLHWVNEALASVPASFRAFLVEREYYALGDVADGHQNTRILIPVSTDQLQSLTRLTLALVLDVQFAGMRTAQFTDTCSIFVINDKDGQYKDRAPLAASKFTPSADSERADPYVIRSHDLLSGGWCYEFPYPLRDPRSCSTGLVTLKSMADGLVDAYKRSADYTLGQSAMCSDLPVSGGAGPSL